MTRTKRKLAAEVAKMPAIVTERLDMTVSERLGVGRPPQSPPWRVTVVAPIVQFKLNGRWPRDLPEDDPDCAADDLHGYGSTREEALADALRMLRRVTWIAVMPDDSRSA